MKKLLYAFIFLSFISTFGIICHAEDMNKTLYISEGEEEKLILTLGKEGENIFSGSLSEAVDFIGDKFAGYDLIFNDVTLHENLIFEGSDYSIGGKISFVDETGIIVYSDASLKISDGTISSENTAAITNEGCTSISGGKVESDSFTAIDNKGELYLSGSVIIAGVYSDISSDREIYLSREEKRFSSENTVRIHFDRVFSEGSITELFFDASPDSLERIKVLSQDGKEYEATFFEKSRYSENECFGGVYLPFYLKLFYKNTELYREERLLGESYSGQYDVNKEGYKFKGLFWDEQLTHIYSEGDSITADTILYINYELEPISFEISSLSFTYDGKNRYLGFDNIYHPLQDDGGFVTYEWFLADERLSSAESLKLKNVSDSGEYSCRVVFHYLSDSSSVNVEGISVKISKALVDPPSISPLTYNGFSQKPYIKPSSLYRSDEKEFIDAGSYIIKIELTDYENYEWKGYEDKEIEREFVIEKAENLFTEELSVYDIFFGEKVDPKAKSLFGEVIFKFSSDRNGEYLSNIPSEVGEYYVKAYVPGNNNYFSLESEVLKFNINAEKIISIEVSSAPNKNDYVAFDEFEKNGLTILVSYNNGRSVTVESDDIDVIYRSAQSLRYGDGGIIISYGGINLLYPLNITKKVLELPVDLFLDQSVVYDGKYHSFNTEMLNFKLEDGHDFKCEAEGGGVDAGTYKTILSFSSDSLNYVLPEDVIVDFEIEKAKNTLIWDNLTFVYDGTSKLPTAYYIDVFGVKKYPIVSGAKVNAGEDYIVSAIDSGGNYYFDNPENSFNITKADLDFSAVKWSETVFVYDGTEKNVFLEGLPEGATLVGYSDNRKVNSGIYITKATLDYDENNYNAPPELFVEWTIKKAVYDMSGVVFEDVTATFDGNTHYPLQVGNLPIGKDGSSPVISFDRGATHVSEGRVYVNIVFSSESVNYESPESMVSTVEILPKGITVNWQATELFYTGAEQAPKASVDECDIIVKGGKNAGRHTAKAVSQNSDYYLINDSFDFTIQRGENYFEESPEARDVYYGKLPSISAKPAFGEAVVSYYSDALCEEKLGVPTEVGIYYCIVTVPESENYYGLDSEILCFRIIAVEAVSLSVNITKEKLVAFEKIEASDYTAVVIYNDGSESSVYDLNVEYTNGDSLRRGDTKVKFYYGEVMCETEVEVDYSLLDLSDAFWEDTVQIYDGEEKTPRLAGLPRGVTVIGYEGGGKIFAGEYTVYAELSYDRDNYSLDTVPSVTFIIKKQNVECSPLEPVIYSGGDIAVPSGNELYSIHYEGKIKNAGLYNLSATINDKDNYTFSNGSENATLIFCVLPIEIMLKVEDYDLYLFSQIPKIEYVVIGGTVLKGESYEVEQSIEGDNIILKSTNPNYLLVGNVSKINRIQRLEPQLAENLFYAIILSVLLILLVLIFILRRKEICALLYKLSERINRKRIKTRRLLEAGKSERIYYLPEAFSKEEKEIRNIEYDSLDMCGIDVKHADELITDSLAKDLLKRSREVIYTKGWGKEIINVDTLNDNFYSGDRVDINVLKEKGLVSENTAYIKVLARGEINKSLSVYANDFSLSAIKMIALMGGEAIKVITVKEKRNKE